MKIFHLGNYAGPLGDQTDYEYDVIKNFGDIDFTSIGENTPVVFFITELSEIRTQYSFLIEKICERRILNNDCRRFYLSSSNFKSNHIALIRKPNTQIQNFWDLDIIDHIDLDDQFSRDTVGLDPINLDVFLKKIKFSQTKDERHGISNKWAAINLSRSLVLEHTRSDKSLLEAYKLATTKPIDFKEILKALKQDEELKDIKVIKQADSISALLQFKDTDDIKLFDDQGKIWEEPMKKLLGVKKMTCETSFDVEISEFNNLSLLLWDLRFGSTSPKESLDKLSEFKTAYPGVPVIVFTASNKSWNRDAAFQAGADGYWLKEGIGDDDDTVFNTWVSNLKTMFLVKAKYDVLSRYWFQITKIKDSLDTCFVRRDNIEQTKFVNRIDERLGMFFGLLKRGFEQNQYNKVNFHYDDYELSFLTLWSLMNDISEALIEKTRDGFSVNQGRNSQNQFRGVPIYDYRLFGETHDRRYLFKEEISYTETIGLNGARKSILDSKQKKTKMRFFHPRNRNSEGHFELPYFYIDFNQGGDLIYSKPKEFPPLTDKLFFQLSFVIWNKHFYNCEKEQETYRNQLVKDLLELNELRNKLYLTHGENIHFYKRTQKEHRLNSNIKPEGDIRKLFNLVAFLLTNNENIKVEFS